MTSPRPVAAPGVEGEETTAIPLWRRPRTLLLAVAVLHTASPLILLGLHWWFGVDETVYLSQLNRYVPAGVFSAPRARGATLLAAPVTLLTTSVAAVRVWVAFLSGLSLYLAFRPWLRLRPGYLVPVAALLFASLWPVIFYGFEVMPNEWVAFAALCATGYVLRFVDEGRRWQLIPVALSMTFAALLRPSDAVYLGAGLLLGCLVLRVSVRRRVAVLLAAAFGGAIGIAQWVLEARASFGGTRARIHAAQAENGGSGLHFAGAAQARVLGGPILCRNRCQVHDSAVYQLWWIVLAVLVLAALIQAWRRGRLAMQLFPVVVGLALAAQYVFTVTYAAPRFLIPTYALLSIPCASALEVIAGSVRAKGPRIALVGALGAAFVAHQAVQDVVIKSNIAPALQPFNDQMLADARALRGMGLRPPCLIMQNNGLNQDLAYAARCANSPRDATRVRERVVSGTRVVWLSRVHPPPRFHFIAHRVRLPGPSSSTRPQYAYVSFVPDLGR